MPLLAIKLEKITSVKALLGEPNSQGIESQTIQLLG